MGTFWLSTGYLEKIGVLHLQQYGVLPPLGAVSDKVCLGDGVFWKLHNRIVLLGCKRGGINFLHLKSIALFITALAFSAFTLYLHLAFKMYLRCGCLNEVPQNALLWHICCSDMAGWTWMSSFFDFYTHAHILGGLVILVQWVGWCNMVIRLLPRGRTPIPHQETAI